MAEYQSTPGEHGRQLETTDAAAAVGEAMEFGERALERTAKGARAVRETAMEHPLATLAIVAGLGFAIGALWKISGSRRQSAYDGLLARFSDLRRQSD